MQVIAPYFLGKEQGVELLELDNQNQDTKIFSKSKIKTKQINVDANAKDLNQTVRDLFLNENKTNTNRVLDIGGNATTSNFIQSLKSTHMYNMVDLFVVPMSGGSQDLKNAKDTLLMILSMNSNAKKLLFALSRVRESKEFNSNMVIFQDEDLKNYPYIILPSDCIDLSRKLKKTVYELAEDEQEKENINPKTARSFRF